jgi:hypothetical protein
LARENCDNGIFKEPIKGRVALRKLNLRDRLSTLHKEFQIRLFPDREHSIGPEVTTLTVEFFQRKLK